MSRVKEHCELCGRKLSVANLDRFPVSAAAGGGFIYNCKDEVRCDEVMLLAGETPPDRSAVGNIATLDSHPPGVV